MQSIKQNLEEEFPSLFETQFTNYLESETLKKAAITVHKLCEKKDLGSLKTMI